MPRLRLATVPVTPFGQNCRLAWDEGSRRGAVIDPGGDVERILAAVAATGAVVDKIVLTHGHIDHAGGAAALKEALAARGADAPVIGPDRRDRFLLDGLARQGRQYGMDDARDLVPDRWLAEGEEVALGESAFAVLHCPGHTPGHVALFDAAARFAIVGDVLFKGSVGRTDFPYGDGDALLGSIRGKLFPLGDDVAFVCGHGPGSTLGAERRSNPFCGEGA